VPQKGKVTISCQLKDASVSVGGTFIGNAPCTLSLSDGIHIIEVTLAGYRNFRKEMRVFAGSDVAVRVTLEKP